MDKPFAITLDVGSSLANKTGSWRTMRPVYVDRLPPCNHACPAGENIQGWLAHAESGGYEAAWRVLTQDNPLPAVMGRVCYHPCETACNRAALDAAVGINSVEPAEVPMITSRSSSSRPSLGSARFENTQMLDVLFALPSQPNLRMSNCTLGEFPAWA